MVVGGLVSKIPPSRYNKSLTLRREGQGIHLISVRGNRLSKRLSNSLSRVTLAHRPLTRKSVRNLVSKYVSKWSSRPGTRSLSIEDLETHRHYPNPGHRYSSRSTDRI